MMIGDKLNYNRCGGGGGGTDGASATSDWSIKGVTEVNQMTVCCQCHLAINDRFVHRVGPDLQWHSACLKCHVCHQTLHDTCFLRDRFTYCRRDFARLFGATCRHCSSRFSADDLVVRVHDDVIFHFNCFRCIVCRRQLVKGEEFVLEGEGPCCRDDFERIQSAMSGAGGSSPEGTVSGATRGSGGPRDEGSVDGSSGRGRGGQDEPKISEYVSKFFADRRANDDAGVVGPSLLTPPMSSGGGSTSTSSTTSSSAIVSPLESTPLRPSNPFPCPPSPPEDPASPARSPFRPSDFLRSHETTPTKSTSHAHHRHDRHQQKSTRIRTVMSELQLHTLRTCYAANPRPDALVKEQLVEMTGLSSRVIRVWFQNKRCKDKKRTILIKQLQQEQQLLEQDEQTKEQQAQQQKIAENMTQSDHTPAHQPPAFLPSLTAGMGLGSWEDAVTSYHQPYCEPLEGLAFIVNSLNCDVISMENDMNAAMTTMSDNECPTPRAQQMLTDDVICASMTSYFKDDYCEESTDYHLDYNTMS